MGTVTMQAALNDDIARASFAGNWLCTSTDNHEALLVEFGVGYMKRCAASTMSYGANKQRLNISISGETVTVQNTSGPSETTQSFRFGEAITVDAPDGSTITATPIMSNGVWTMSAPKLSIEREIMPNGQMRQTMTSAKGVVAHRF